MPDLCLALESAYQTGRQSVSWLGSCFPTAVYYSKILGIVSRASKLAKKGLYDDQRWIESSLTTVRALESVGVRFEVQGLDVIGGLQSTCVFIGKKELYQASSQLVARSPKRTEFLKPL